MRDYENIFKVSNLLIIPALAFFVFSIYYKVNAQEDAPLSEEPKLIKTSLTERDVAIYNARKKGLTEYSFTTRYIPGMGFVDDPEIYIRQWEEQNMNMINNEESAPSIGDAFRNLTESITSSSR